MIYAWDNYPIRQFPGLWEWIQAQIEEKQLVMTRVAFEEVENKMPDCGEWLSHNDLEKLEISNSILQTAMRIKGLLGIVGDGYNPKGVGENDIIILASAYVTGAKLVSNEGRQTPPPL